MPLSIFIACNGAPADHFAQFSKELSEEGEKVVIYALEGPACTKFQQHNVTVETFSIKNCSAEEQDALAKQIANACSSASSVVTDVGHPFSEKVQKALAIDAKHIPRAAYYENFESWVPGGYSETAAKVMRASQIVLFANSHLATKPIFEKEDQEVDFGERQRFGIGYYPVQYADTIAARRIKEQSILRKQLFEENQLVDKGQEVFVYFGGNNTEYFDHAFPAFLSLLEGLSDLVIVIHQHPGAKEKNIDAKKVAAWIEEPREAKIPKIIMSTFKNPDDAQVVANRAFYYQTTMGPQFGLAKIPTTQIGHKPYEDILVKNQLIKSVTKKEQLANIIANPSDQSIDREVILEALGIDKDYIKNLKQALFPSK